MNKISTIHYLYLRDTNKIDLLKDAKKEVDRLSEVLHYTLNNFYKKKISKNKVKIIFNPSISTIVQFYIVSEKIKFDNFKVKDDFINLPINIYNLERLADKNYRLLFESIEKIKNKYITKEKINSNEIKIIKKTKKNTLRYALNYSIKKIINLIFSFRNKKIFLDKFDLKLFLNLILNGKSPQMFLMKNFKNKKNYDYDIRMRLFKIGNKLNNNKEQEKSWYTMIFQLPISLVENFEDLNSLFEKLIIKIDKFVLFSVIRKELDLFLITKYLDTKDTKLETYQYGCGPFFSNQHHYGIEFNYEVSDKYYTWSNVDYDKTIQIPLFKTINHNYKLRKIKKILLINSSFSYFNKLVNGPMFDGVNKNFFNQIEFLKIIKKNFNDIIIKNPSYEVEDFRKRNYYQKFDLEKYLTNIKLDKLYSDETLPVCSYLGTTFLELMANDVPHILFYRPSEFNANPKVSNYLKMMKKYKFIFYSPKNAARFIVENQSNLRKMWDNEDFYKLREDFRKQFCNNKNNVENIFLKQIMS